MDSAATMRVVEADDFSIEALHLVQRPIPRPRRGELLVRVRAASLNYRDRAILTERILPTLPLPYVPASDASGEVTEVGEDVTRFKVGDRVTPIFTQGWHDGMPTPDQRYERTLGAPLTGVLQEYVVVPADDAVSVPPHLGDAEAATLPIAAVTAWSTLAEADVRPGHVVVVQGTGGVALFALQFARLAGARVITLSSSDEKLARARRLGAEVGINHRTTPDWHVVVKEVTQGRGADVIVETVGNTLHRSIAALAFGGFIGVVGFVGGYEATLSIPQVMGPMARIQGIAIGSRARFEAMNRAISQHRLRPVIDRTFPLEQAGEAFRYMKAGRHFGKIVIAL